MSNKLNKILLTTSLAAVIGVSMAKADDFNFTAAIDILEALKVKETQKMDFGVIERPATEAKVNIASRSCEGSADGTNHIDKSTIACGKYRISGSSLKTISIQLKDGGSVEGLNFTGIEGAYNNDHEVTLDNGGNGLPAPTQEGKDLQLGATLLVSGTVEEGTYAPDFNMTVNYE